MMTTIIPSVLLTVLFMGMVIMRERSVPVSISAMVYALPEGGWRWLWALWLWAVTFFTEVICYVSMVGSLMNNPPASS